MERTTVKEFMKFFKDDVRVLVNKEETLEQLYSGNVSGVPAVIANMAVKVMGLDTEGDEPMVGIIVMY